jgi:plastocyanin
MRRSTVARVLALTAVWAVGAAPALAPAAKPHHHAQGKLRTVGVESDFYDPAQLTIHVGDRVKWTWHSSGFSLHDVYVDSGPATFHSPTQAAGTYARTFTKPGVYRLYCTQHESDMTMVLTVRKLPKNG